MARTKYRCHSTLVVPLSTLIRPIHSLMSTRVGKKYRDYEELKSRGTYSGITE